MHPEIDFHLQFTPFEPFELFQDSDGEQNARRGDFVLHLKEDLNSQLDLNKIDVLYVYGIGLGFHLEHLTSWLKEKSSRVLVILEDDLGALDAFFKTAHQLNNPQIFLKFIPDSNMWDHVLEECAKNFSSARIQVVALPSYAIRKSSRLEESKLSIQRKTTLWNALLSEELLSPLFHRNILENIRRLPETFYVNKWEGAFRNVPAIICGAGPSLAKAQAEQAKVIAAQTATMARITAKLEELKP